MLLLLPHATRASKLHCRRRHPIENLTEDGKKKGGGESRNISPQMSTSGHQRLFVLASSGGKSCLTSAWQLPHSCATLAICLMIHPSLGSSSTIQSITHKTTKKKKKNPFSTPNILHTCFIDTPYPSPPIFLPPPGDIFPLPACAAPYPGTITSDSCAAAVSATAASCATPGSSQSRR